MTIVCVAAHQDDEMGCLATLLRLRREGGRDIAFLTLTAGDKGMSWNPEIALDEAARTREAEMRAVAAELDARYVCLREEDGFLADTPSLRRSVIEALRGLDADLVFTHWTEDYNEDHVVTARVTRHAALLSQIASVRTEAPPLARPPRIFHMDPGPGYGFEATHFVPYGEDIAAEKARVLRLHRSQMDVMLQLSGRDYADIALDRDRQTGARLLEPFAESFRACLMERRIPLPGDLP